MDEKLILQIQATLKDLIYSKRKVNLLWTLNMQIEELRRPFLSEEPKDQKGPDPQFVEYKIAEKLNIDILYCEKEDMYYFKSGSAYIKYEDNFLRRHKLAIYNDCKDLIGSKKSLKSVEMIYPLHKAVELYIIDFAIGYCILNYGTNRKINYPIYDIKEMFFRNREEKVIDLFARTLLVPTLFILEKLSYEREKEIKHKKNYEYISNVDICWDDLLGFKYFIPIRIHEVRELIADISVTRPEVYEEIKAKYPLLFCNIDY